MAHYPTSSIANAQEKAHRGSDRRETAAVTPHKAADVWIGDEEWEAGLASKAGDGPGLWSCKQFGWLTCS